MYHKTGVDLNYMEYSNPEIDRLCEMMDIELDPDKKDQLIREASLVLMRDVAALPISIVPSRIHWWPWVKNYFGSWTIEDDCCFSELLPYMWIDQDLKKEMGY